MCMLLKMKFQKQNKRADLPTLILVILIFALLITTLFSFYFAGNKLAKLANDVSSLREVRNLADSVEYSVKNVNPEAYQWYVGTKLENGKIIIEKSFDGDNLRVRYTLTP
jgi:hypothetical protein